MCNVRVMTIDSYIRRRTDGQSYVYVISPAEPDAHNLSDRCKVGVSDAPERRLMDMQLSSPVRLQVSYSCLAPAQLVRAAENAAQAVLRPSRLYSEWFRCPPDDVAYLLETAMRSGDLLERRIKRPFYKLSDRSDMTPVPRMRIKRGAMWLE